MSALMWFAAGVVTGAAVMLLVLLAVMLAAYVIDGREDLE
jgi:hypothetical protein